eukprot:TRINITY_DN37134_c0_g1_i1.p1 TRINITY_DN37134_c0_g1~~TRINITY_DN37134_c0_g1_i1.p1  ORF type:complete len:146 (-),score=29.29 TRINITY_DN37134_c0_g1_i1:33-470(-)
MDQVSCQLCIFFFSSRRRHTRCREVSWARRCVQETGIKIAIQHLFLNFEIRAYLISSSTIFAGIISAFSSLHRFCATTKSIPCFSLLIWLLFSSYSNFMQLLLRSHVPVSYTHLTLPTILLVQISVVAVSFKKKNQTIEDCGTTW